MISASRRGLMSALLITAGASLVAGPAFAQAANELQLTDLQNLLLTVEPNGKGLLWRMRHRGRAPSWPRDEYASRVAELLPDQVLLDDAMSLAERFLSYIASRVLETRQEELKTLERDTAKLEAIVPPFPRLHYDEAVKMLHEGFAAGAVENKFEWGGDLGAPDETYLSSKYDKPVMVHHYPAAVKAFYMKRDPEREEIALGVDVLAPEGYGEVIGGGERSTSLEFLQLQIAAHGLPQEAFEWYLDLRRYGSVPHAGFGLGVERTVAWICGLHHVRETIPFPRMMERLTP